MNQPENKPKQSDAADTILTVQVGDIFFGIVAIYFSVLFALKFAI